MIDQAFIGLFGVTAIWLSQDKNDSRRRWACIAGLCAQPFWFYTTITHGQWVILVLNFLYTWGWIKGVNTHWMQRKSLVQQLPERGRVYISGPMTGLPERNHPLFNRVAACLRMAGYVVENPADLDPPPGDRWEDWMRKALAQLLLCDEVYMLPGWEKSKGARTEKHIAETIGLRIVYYGHFTARFAPPTTQETAT